MYHYLSMPLYHVHLPVFLLCDRWRHHRLFLCNASWNLTRIGDFSDMDIYVIYNLLLEYKQGHHHILVNFLFLRMPPGYADARCD